MPYRRTENVVRRLTARKDSIVAAARAVATEGGMAAIQILPIAARADIAAGTVYRYFPGKTELLGALIANVSEREMTALRASADAAPGPLSALAAAIATFAARALRNRRLTYALIAEPVDADIDAIRLAFRKSLADDFSARIQSAIASGHLPEQDASIAAPALVGALLEGLIGPLAPDLSGDSAKAREAVQMLVLYLLRALGVADAHARGIVVQTAVPLDDERAELTSSRQP
jgi:AcrR family transcriptional regulator